MLSSVFPLQAVRILQQAPVQSKFVISKKLSMPASELQTIRVKPPIDVSRLSGDESSRSNSSGKDAFVVQIDKGIGGLGLSLAGGAGSPPEFKGASYYYYFCYRQPGSECKVPESVKLPTSGIARRVSRCYLPIFS